MSEHASSLRQLTRDGQLELGGEEVQYILKLIEWIGQQRGKESQRAVIRALETLSGVVRHEASAPYSNADRNGVDIMITICTHIKIQNRWGKPVIRKREIKFPLQVKSSFEPAKKFVQSGDGSIPVIVITAGAGTQEILDAFTRIVDRKRRRQKRIIEIAKLKQ